MKRIVLDTNVMSVIISRRSRYYPIYESLRNGDFLLLTTTDILLEYEEIIGRNLSSEVAMVILKTLETLPNVQHISKYYFWKLITDDPDDDKFADCAIAGTADFLVTNDKHFNVLKNIPFPKINVLNIDEFLEIINELRN